LSYNKEKKKRVPLFKALYSIAHTDSITRIVRRVYADVRFNEWLVFYLIKHPFPNPIRVLCFLVFAMHARARKPFAACTRGSNQNYD
jgi:hypothetical protein